MKFIFPKDVQGYLSYGEGKLLFRLAQVNPELGKVVELGSFHGRSTICLAQGSRKASGGKVFTVDTFVGDQYMGKRADYYNQFKKNIKNYHLEKDISVLRGDTVEVSKKWRGPIRFLFIDASHSYEEASNDFHSWEKYIVPRGIMALHDSLYWPGVHRFVYEFIKSGDYQSFTTFSGPGSTGLTYAFKKLENESISVVTRYKAFLAFGWLGLRNRPWIRFKIMINERGESDFWFRFFGTMANCWRKLKGRIGIQ